MSNGESRNVSQNLQLVHNRIEQCLQLYMTQKEAMNTLLMEDNIEPHVTEFVWQRLEQQNQEFFKAYYLKLMVKEQILEFNRLLTEQVELMRRIGQTGIASIPMSNGSRIASIHQSSACSTGETARLCLKPEDMQKTISTTLPIAFNNCRSSVQSGIQAGVDISAHCREIDVSPNIMLAQNSNIGITQAVNGKMIKSEPGFGCGSSFEFNAHDFLDSRSVVGDAPISSFTSAESNSQTLNETLLDRDGASFGYLGHISQSISIPDLTADFTNNSDILESYSRATFLTADTSNFLDHNGTMAHQGNVDPLATPTEGLRYEDFGSD